jgi:alkylated DNA repair dioxygenase AlkB
MAELESKIKDLANGLKNKEPLQDKKPSKVTSPYDAPPETLDPLILSSPEKPYSQYSEDFLSNQELSDLTSFLQEAVTANKFVNENGHSVLSYGKPYHYTGSQTPSHPEAIPPELTKIIDKLTVELKLDQPPNSVLINHYPKCEPGETASFLASHSDDEPVILPDSNIVTLSIGAARNIVFKPIHDANTGESTLELKGNSVYSMTRKSQAWFRHRIPAPEGGSQERFSISFRTVDEKLQRSTVIQGDSNTKEILFGEGSGKVGASYPGQRVKCAK